MSSNPRTEPAAPDEWTKEGERQEARNLAGRIRSFVSEARLPNNRMLRDLRDIAERLENVTNG